MHLTSKACINFLTDGDYASGTVQIALNDRAVYFTGSACRISMIAIRTTVLVKQESMEWFPGRSSSAEEAVVEATAALAAELFGDDVHQLSESWRHPF